MKLRLRDVYAAAESANCLHQVRQSFRREYAEQVVEAYETKTAEEVMEVFMTSLKTHDTLRVMENKLNIADFTKRLCAGHWEISGRGKNGEHILWVRAGLANVKFGSRRSLRSGTQEWYSAIRAGIYMYELFIRTRLLQYPMPSSAIICYDCRGQGFLDFNCQYEHAYLQLAMKIFPEMMHDRYFVLGLSPAASRVLNAVLNVYSRKYSITFMSNPEQAMDFVQCESDIPKWLLQFTPHSEKIDSKHVFGLNRITKAEESSRIKHEEIFNPAKDCQDDYVLPSSNDNDPAFEECKGEYASMFSGPSGVISSEPNSRSDLNQLDIIAEDSGEENDFT